MCVLESICVATKAHILLHIMWEIFHVRTKGCALLSLVTSLISMGGQQVSLDRNTLKMFSIYMQLFYVFMECSMTFEYSYTIDNRIRGADISLASAHCTCGNS